jgi:hypothetical protein
MARPLSFVVREEDIERIGKLRYEHPHPRVRQRCWVLWFVSRNLTLTQACELAGVSRITGWRYGEVYQEKGLDGLLAMHWDGPESGLTPYREMLEASFREQPPHTVAEAVQRIESGATALQRVGCVERRHEHLAGRYEHHRGECRHGM